MALTAKKVYAVLNNKIKAMEEKNEAADYL